MNKTTVNSTSRLSLNSITRGATGPSQALWCLLLIAIYFGLQTLLRTLVSDALELDEAEQVVWAQRLAWGYGEQPPLYSWVQWAFFQVFGVNVFALALLKNLLLCGLYLFTFFAAREVLPSHLAIASTLSLILFPQIGWESQRDLTHSVLLTFLAAATLFLFIRTLRTPSMVNYLLLGLAAGLGLLSKYSFALFLLTVGLAAVWDPNARRIYRSRWAIASVVVALVVVFPHALWLLDHAAEVTEATRHKLDPNETASGLIDMLRGIVSFTGSALSFIAAWILIVAAFVWLDRKPLRQTRESRVAEPLLSKAYWGRYFAVLAILVISLIVFGGASQFKARWLQPLLFCAPLAVFTSLPQCFGTRFTVRLAVAAGLMGCAVLVAIGVRPYASGARTNPGEWNAPTHELASALRDAGYDGRAHIATTDRVLGGNLKLRFPSAFVHVGAGSVEGHLDPLLLIDQQLKGSLPGLVGKSVQFAALADVRTVKLEFRNSRPAGKIVTYDFILPDGKRHKPDSGPCEDDRR